MNEYVEDSLYDVLDRLSTKLVQLYYLNSWELDDKDGMRVSGNITLWIQIFDTMTVTILLMKILERSKIICR